MGVHKTYVYIYIYTHNHIYSVGYLPPIKPKSHYIKNPPSLKAVFSRNLRPNASIDPFREGNLPWKKNPLTDELLMEDSFGVSIFFAWQFFEKLPPPEKKQFAVHKIHIRNP